MIVNLPGRPLALGRIAELTSVADRLPEEFQPRFKPVERQRLVVVELEPEVLQGLPILTTASLYRPVGLETALEAYGSVRRTYTRLRAFAAADRAPRS